MTAMIVAAAGLLAIAAVVGLVIYVVREATVLKTTAADLREELRQFKEGGFDRLVSEKLAPLTQRATEELAARERLIQQNRAELLEQQQRTSQAIERIKQDFGVVTTKIQGLDELQAKVGELNDLLKP